MGIKPGKGWHRDDTGEGALPPAPTAQLLICNRCRSGRGQGRRAACMLLTRYAGASLRCAGGVCVAADMVNVQPQEYIDVSRQRLGRPHLDLLQLYWWVGAPLGIDLPARMLPQLCLLVNSRHGPGRHRYIPGLRWQPKLCQTCVSPMPLSDLVSYYSFV